MIYSNDSALYIATDKRKNVYADIINNSQVELAAYNLNTRKWIRISGKMKVESSSKIQEEMISMYPIIKQEYIDKDQIYLVIFKLLIENMNIC